MFMFILLDKYSAACMYPIIHAILNVVVTYIG